MAEAGALALRGKDEDLEFVPLGEEGLASGGPNNSLQDDPGRSSRR